MIYVSVVDCSVSCGLSDGGFEGIGMRRNFKRHDRPGWMTGYFCDIEDGAADKDSTVQRIIDVVGPLEDRRNDPCGHHFPWNLGTLANGQGARA